MIRTAGFLALTLACVTVISGCGVKMDQMVPSTPGQTSVGTIHGNVHGGQQPVSGARVYLYAAGTNGSGGNGIAASAANASTSLLNASVLTNSPGNSGLDSSMHYYVTTDTNGNFSITGDYSCTATTQVYLYVIGGNPGQGANSAVGLLAGLGQCPASGSLAASVPFVVVNEVSTIATAYALAGFATDATHISSDNTVSGNLTASQAATGLANAMANVANIINVATGNALTATSASGSTGVVPQAEINTLADILASCVNTTGPSSSPCTTLFASATSDGTSNGTKPTDTATAAIYMAQHPGANISTLYGLQNATSPFMPVLSAQPNDFTLALQFSGGGLNGEYQLALDSGGNVWVANGNNSISKFSSSGVPFSGSGGFTGGGLNGANGIAIDPNDNAWLINFRANSVSKFSNDGTPVSGANGYTGGGLFYPFAIAIDASGNVWATSNGDGITKFYNNGIPVPGTPYGSSTINDPESVAIDASGTVWVADTADARLFPVSNSGVVSGPYTGGGMSYPVGVAMDSSGHIWIANGGAARISEFSNTGTAVSSTGYTGGGLGADVSAIAVDGAGNVWATSTNNRLSEFSNAGVPISGSNGYQGGGLSRPLSLSVDQSGNVWVQNRNANVLTEFVGAAAPAVMPFSVAQETNKLGTRP